MVDKVVFRTLVGAFLLAGAAIAATLFGVVELLIWLFHHL